MTFNSTTATIARAKNKSKSDEIEKKKHLQTLPALNQMYINRYQNLKRKFIDYIYNHRIYSLFGEKQHHFSNLDLVFYLIIL